MIAVLSFLSLIGIAGDGSHSGSGPSTAYEEGVACIERIRAGGGGGEVPTPFEHTNLRVELADGEYYLLVGWVNYSAGKPYLLIDSTEQPWLQAKSGKTKAYPLNVPARSGASFKKKFEGTYVRIAVKAAGRIVKSTAGIYYEMSLDVLSPDSAGR